MMIRAIETDDEADDEIYCRELWDECVDDPADEVVSLDDLAERLGVALPRDFSITDLMQK